MSADEAARAGAEELLARLETRAAKLEATEDPDEAIEMLQELAELAKEVEAELQRAAPRRGGGCRGRLRSSASSSRPTSASWR